MISLPGALLPAVALIVSCTSAPSQLLVWVDTDLSPCALPQVRVRCGYDWDGQQGTPDPQCSQTYTRTGPSPTILVPGSLGFTADPARVHDSFTIVFDDGSAAPALQRTVRFSFVPQQTAQLTVALASGCLIVAGASNVHPCPPGLTQCTQSQSCASVPGMTCGNDATCRPSAVSSSELLVASLPTPGARRHRR